MLFNTAIAKKGVEGFSDHGSVVSRSEPLAEELFLGETKHNISHFHSGDQN
jgi:hypothetical protein